MKPVAQHAVPVTAVVALGNGTSSAALLQSPLSSCSTVGSSQLTEHEEYVGSAPSVGSTGIITAYYPCPPELWRPPVSYRVLPSYPPVMPPAAIFSPVEQPYMTRMYYSPAFTPGLLSADGRYCAGYVRLDFLCLLGWELQVIRSD